MGAGDRVRKQQRDAVDEARDETAVGSAPAVLVLEAGDHASDRDEHRVAPVRTGGDADEHACDRADDRRHDTSEHDLRGSWTISKQRRLIHLSPPRSSRQTLPRRHTLRCTVASTNAPFRLSVLDQSPIAEGSTGAQALENTLDLARLTDALGYHRYWVAEHHGGPMLAGPSPEALIGPIAAATTRIRVGSGGVMLPHYSPLKVAETFSLLAGLFPDASTSRSGAPRVPTR